jgi:hypothetical protein
MPEIRKISRTVWAELRAKRPLSDGEFGFQPIFGAEVVPSMGLFVDAAGGLHFLIVTQGPPTREMPPDFSGVRSCRRYLSDGREVLDIYSPAAHEAAFTPLCNDLIGVLTEGHRDTWAAAGSVIRNWQAAFKPTRLAMDKFKQVGLFGELWVLEKLLIPNHGPTAIDFWGGPEGDRHDFEGKRLNIETKATRGDGFNFIISRVDQLSAPPGKRLLLATLRLEESLGGRQTIATKIDSILELLVANASAQEEFFFKLDKVGWSDELRRSGDLVKLEVRGADFYEVDSDFPRIPADFVMPAGVVKLEYTINLSNVSGLDESEIKAAVALM